MDKPFIVGITGGSASGKTYFLNSLLNAFGPEEICLVSQDNYYHPQERQRKDENGIYNYDIPESINFRDFVKDIEALRAGNTVSKQEYTFNNPAIIPKTLSFRPAPVVVVEGIFVFYLPELMSQLDLKIFIDAEEHVKLRRRIVRDHEERGYGLDDVLYRYEKHVAPTYDKYIKPFKSDADLVVPNNQGCDKALEVIISYLKSKI